MPQLQPLCIHLLLQVFGIHCQTICLPFQLFLFLEELSNITYSSSLTLTVVQNLARSNQLNVSHFVIQRQLLLLRRPETPCRPSKGVPSERLRLAEVINFPKATYWRMCKSCVSHVQSIEPHSILAPIRDLYQGPPGSQSSVVTTILQQCTSGL